MKYLIMYLVILFKVHTNYSKIVKFFVSLLLYIVTSINHTTYLTLPYKNSLSKK